MLAVITDDLTGAAEIGGLALARGFSATIETRAVRSTSSDVLIVATNMRSMTAEAASELSAVLTSQLGALRPDLIFKKVDSVLRGHIGPELRAMMEVLDRHRALLVPANPSLGRSIEDGVYSIRGVPIAATSFAPDGSPADATSNVVDILRARGCPDLTSLAAEGYSSVADGIVIGDARSASDLRKWAQKVDGEVIPAGGAEFFAALLDRLKPRPAAPASASSAPAWGRRSLYICGSRFPSSAQAVQAAAANGYCVVDLPDAIYFDRDHDVRSVDQWAVEVTEAFATFDAVILSAPQTANDTSISGTQLSHIFARCVTGVLQQVPVEELLVEGGATAQAVMTGLDVETLHPVQSLSPGVTRMRAGERHRLHITMKPGSYNWPGAAWMFGKARVA